MADDLLRERDRCVDRLRSMPLTRLPEAAELAYAACQAVLALDPVARSHPLPRIADRAAGDQLAVVVDDLIRTGPDSTVAAEATQILTTLRRCLP